MRRVIKFDPRTYWEDRHYRNYGPESVGYAGLGVPFNNWMYRVRRRVVERQLRKAAIDLSECDVLDIGSGTGFYVQLWDKLGAKSVTGSDLAPFAVRALAEKFSSHRFFDLDISGNGLPIDLGKFDLVSAFDVLYHIVQDDAYRRAFSNIKSLVRPGGYFIFSENFLLQKRETLTHQVSRTYTEVAALLAENEFELILRAPMFFFMNRPIKSSNVLLRVSWAAIRRIAGMTHRPYLGSWLGALLYPIELLCLCFISTGPTTEVFLCRLRN